NPMNGLRRYKRYADIPSDVRRQAQALSAKSPWRQQYHIEPKTAYDSHGPYSGSAISVGDELLFFYTGNTRDACWQRTPYQLIAR
ncbi:hypothetical protein KHU12_26070, partial [Pseudocitrobacter faecalis]